MLYQKNSVRCVYERNAFSGETAVLLHGWGGDLRSMHGLYEYLTLMGMACVNIAFPKTVPVFWGVYDYARYLEVMLQELDITLYSAVGHSFGGRVSLVLAAGGKVKNLVLLDSAGIKPRYSIARAVKVYAYKRARAKGKPLDRFGSADYKALPDCMKSVFVNVVNEDLTGILSEITAPTTILWGKRDKETPPYMARKLHRKIANSTLIWLKGDHFAYLQDASANKKIYMALKGE